MIQNILLNGESLPPIGLGTMGYGGFFSRDNTEQQKYLNLISVAYELGLKVIDTAEVYGAGLAEEIIGKLPPSINQDLFLMTKFSAENSEPKKIEESLHASLRRLNREYVDVYQPHWPSADINTEVVANALSKLVEQGKVRYIGLSNFSTNEYKKANLILGHKKVDFIQTEYGPLERTIESELLPEVIKNHSILVGYSPFRNGNIFDEKNKNHQELIDIAEKYAATISQIVLAWILRSGSVISIPKASSEKRIVENFNALNLTLSALDQEKLSKIFEMEMEMIDMGLIDIGSDGDRKIYLSLQEAMQNPHNLVPGPMDIANEIKANNGRLAKPIKIKKNKESDRYTLVEGRVKFWGWMILYGIKSKVPAIIIN
jgi:diketogulonate reductase-like aldo/keto reductase